VAAGEVAQPAMDVVVELERGEDEEGMDIHGIEVEVHGVEVDVHVVEVKMDGAIVVVVTQKMKVPSRESTFINTCI